MLYHTLRHRWLRLLIAGIGALIGAISLNVFIVPQGLYTGGLMGLCQLIRNLVFAHFKVGFGGADLAGILYFLFNIPILALTYRALGRSFIFRTLACTALYSIFYSLVPIPAQPVIEDPLTSCLLGGILAGVGSGIVLTCGCSGGGLDVVGLYLSKRGSHFTVGKFNLSFNFVLYAVFLFLFDPAVVIYSVIYNYFTAMVLDKMHQQNITVQVLIFTREDDPELPRYIMQKLSRGVTYWTGWGGYTGRELRVLCVCVSKYEIEELRHAVHQTDPHAFFIIQEGVVVDGNFDRRVTSA